MENMNEKPLAAIAYHASCSDGKVAAFIAWKATGKVAPSVAVNYDEHKKTVEDQIAKLTEMLGGRDPKDFVLYIVDFSYPSKTLKAIGEVFGAVIVIDHHETTLTDFEKEEIPFRSVEVKDTGSKVILVNHIFNISDNVTAYFCMDRSGGLMTWYYFFDEGSDVIDMVRYTSDRDLYRFVYPQTRAYASGFADFRNLPFEQLENLANETDAIISRGEIVEKTRDVRIASILSKPPTMISFEGYEFGMYNAPADIASDLLHEYTVMSDKPAVGMSYMLGNDGTVYCSLRSRKGHDCSYIAKAMGGGGHSEACGFIISFDKFVELMKTKVLTRDVGESHNS